MKRPVNWPPVDRVPRLAGRAGVALVALILAVALTRDGRTEEPAIAEIPPAEAEDAPAVAETPPVAVAFDAPLPYGLPAIDYHGAAADDRVARWGRRLAAGAAKLEWSEPGGYLKSLLAALDVPVESQLLVFSKTALNPALVTPKNPRAIYFNDDTTVGWVPGADSLELTSVDPVKGPLFYLVPQTRDAAPALRREERCLACHAGTTTLQTPGLVVRSFVPDEIGRPLIGYSRVTHDTPFADRFGGWYVTGTHGDAPHCGNVFGTDASERLRDQPLAAGNQTGLVGFDASKHLAKHSDLAAHLVLQHLAHGQNLLTRVGYEARLGRRSDAEEKLVRYFLFLDEPPLAAPVKGTSGFAEIYGKAAQDEPASRSARTLNLRTRLFETRLSPLVESRAFAALPEATRSSLLTQLERATPDEEAADPADLARRGAEERAAIRARLDAARRRSIRDDQSR